MAKYIIQQKSHLLMQMAFSYFLAAGLASTAASTFFFGLCGLVLPNEPIVIFPLAVFLSPLPMI